MSIEELKQLTQIKENTRIIRMWLNFFGLLTIFTLVASVMHVINN